MEDVADASITPKPWCEIVEKADAIYTPLLEAYDYQMDKYRQTIEMHLTKTKIYLEQIEKQKKQIKELQDENVELTSKALSNAREMNPQTFTDDYTAKLEQQLQESKESYVNLYEENVHNVQEMQQLNTKIQDQYNKIVQFTEVLQKAEDKYIQLQQERDYYKKFRDSVYII